MELQQPLWGSCFFDEINPGETARTKRSSGCKRPLLRELLNRKGSQEMEPSDLLELPLLTATTSPNTSRALTTTYHLCHPCLVLLQPTPTTIQFYYHPTSDALTPLPHFFMFFHHFTTYLLHQKKNLFSTFHPPTLHHPPALVLLIWPSQSESTEATLESRKLLFRHGSSSSSHS